MATYATNYVIAMVALLYAFMLYPKQQDKEQVGKFVCLYLSSTGIAFGVAGVGHQITKEQEELLNQFLLPLTAFAGNVGTFCLFRILILYTKEWEGPVRVAWWVLAICVTVVGAVMAVSSPIITGMVGLISVVSALIVHTLQFIKSKKSALLLKALAFVFLLIGGIFQMVLAPLCGYDAYPDCFPDCPLPAPDFNHNALFHVFAIICYVLYGLGELWLPAQECLSILRRKTSESPDLGAEPGIFQEANHHTPSTLYSK